MKHELPPPHKKPQSLTSHSVLISGKFMASGISPFVSVASSNLIPNSSVPTASHITHVSLQEPVSPSTQYMQFCNTTTETKVELSHHMKQDKSIISILHCIKLLIAVCLGFLYKQFKNMTKKQLPQRILLPHNIMAAPLVKKCLAF